MRMPRLLSEVDGGAVVEMGLVFPIIMAVVFVCLQYALVFVTYVSVLYAGRDVARWLAVHPNTADSTTIAAIDSRLPQNLDPSKMSVAISPACASLNSQGLCANRSLGTQLQVTLTYDASSVYFLPRPPGVPATLPPYTMYFMVEVY